MLKHAKPESLLGRHFDIRDFHDVRFQNGAAPFSITRHSNDTWIAGADSS